MQVTLVQCSPRLMGKKLWKSQVFLSGIPTIQQNSHVEITDEDTVRYFLLYQGYCLLWIRSTRLNNQGNLLWKYGSGYVNLYLEKAWIFGSTTGFSTVTILQLTKRSLSSRFLPKKIDYWRGTPNLFPWFASEWLLTVSKNKVCLKGTNVSGSWRHRQRNNMAKALEAIPQQKLNVSNSVSIIGLSA